METILIATDFTPAAKNATRYGFEFAKTIGAKVILFYAYSLQELVDSAGYFNYDDIEKLGYKQLVEEAEEIDPRGTVLLETLCMPGPSVNAIN